MKTDDRCSRAKFAAYFRKLYMAKSITKAELSRISKISEATLSRIESAIQRPTPDTLKKLAPHLGVSENELMIQAGYLNENDQSEIPVLDDPGVRALARRSLSKDPSKQALLKKLITSMLEDDD